MSEHKRFIIPIFIPHEGCRFRCIFCDQYSVTGAGRDPIGPTEIRDIVSEYVRTSPGWQKDRELAFFGGSFTFLPEKRQEDLLAVGRDLIASGVIDALRISTRPDGINEEIMDRLIRYGVKTVEIGIQSMSDDVLKTCRRGHVASDSVRAAKVLSGRNVEWIAQILPGLPGDTDKTILETASAVADLSPKGIRIYPAIVLSGTDMNRMYENGTYVPLSLDRTLGLLKKMISIFEKRSIPILRIGLCPSVELERRVVAGPYHPALGSLAYEALLLDTVIDSVQETCASYKRIDIHVNPRDVSRAVGSGRSSLTRLEQCYPEKRFAIIADHTLERGRIRTIGI